MALEEWSQRGKGRPKQDQNLAGQTLSSASPYPEPQTYGDIIWVTMGLVGPA